MRRIKVYSEGLIKVWEKYFINDTAKFIKSTHLEREDLGKTYKERNGTEWKVIGAMEGSEIVCKNLSTNELFGISRWKVSMALHPAKHAEWKNGKPKDDAPAPVIEELVVITEEPEATETESEEEEETVPIEALAETVEEDQEAEPEKPYVEPSDEDDDEKEVEEKAAEE